MSIIDKLVDRYQIKDETFDVAVDAEVSLRFRTIRSYADLRRFEKETVDFARLVTDPGYSNPAFKGERITHEEAVAVFTLSHLSAEPKLTEMDAIRLCREAPVLANGLLKAIEAEMNHSRQRAEVARMEEQKKTCLTTDGDETS